jgi:hypothetical protein
MHFSEVHVPKVHKSQIRKFVLINPKIANPQFCKKKTVFLIRIPIGLSVIFFYSRNYILYYELPYNSVSELSWKPKVFLEFEWKYFKLIVVREKIYICWFAEVLSPQQIIGPANRRSTNCHICWRSANVYKKLSPQISGFAIGATYLRNASLYKEQYVFGMEQSM